MQCIKITLNALQIALFVLNKRTYNGRESRRMEVEGSRRMEEKWAEMGMEKERTEGHGSGFTTGWMPLVVVCAVYTVRGIRTYCLVTNSHSFQRFVYVIKA